MPCGKRAAARRGFPPTQLPQPHASNPPALFPLPVPVLQLAPRCPGLPRRHFLLGNPPASPQHPAPFRPVADSSWSGTSRSVASGPRSHHD